MFYLNHENRTIYKGARFSASPMYGGTGKLIVFFSY
jgi:hypothetical protein